jgi:hypothetical protein
MFRAVRFNLSPMTTPSAIREPGHEGVPLLAASNDRTSVVTLLDA